MSATPRMTRSRAQTPLPALATRQSHAYGAQGKAQLSHQVSTSAAEFSQSFANTRARGSTRAPSTAPTNVSTTPAPKNQGRKSPALRDESIDNGPGFGTTANGDGTEMEDGGVRAATSLHHSAAYVSPSAAAAPPPPPPPPSGRESGAHAPTSLRVALLSLLSGAIIGAMLLAALLAAPVVSLPASLDVVRVRLIGPTELDRRWQRFAHLEAAQGALRPDTKYPDVQLAIDRWFLERHERGENRTAHLARELAIQASAISELERVLPNTIVTTLENGEYQVPPAFWKALVDKMSSDDATPLWDGFIDSNQARLDELISTTAAAQLDHEISSERLLTKEAFQEAIIGNNRRVDEKVNGTIRQFRAEMIHEAREAAKSYLETTEIMSMARAQIAAVGKSNIVYNTEKVLREINFLSIGMGALVDPHYTSKTKQPRTDTWGKWIAQKTGLVTKDPNPPSMAILPWQEATDCWCAEPSTSEKGLAQLGIKMKHKIYPRELTIEHVPGPGTRDISAAPNQFEVWAQVDNATEAARINEHLSIYVPHAFDNQCTGMPPNKEKNWVCIAADEYRIHNHNFVQTFTIYPDTIGEQIAVSRIAVRVVKNWGNKDHTCVYRVRMTGQEVNEQVD